MGDGLKLHTTRSCLFHGLVRYLKHSLLVLFFLDVESGIAPMLDIVISVKGPQSISREREV